MIIVGVKEMLSSRFQDLSAFQELIVAFAWPAYPYFTDATIGLYNVSYIVLAILC